MSESSKSFFYVLGFMEKDYPGLIVVSLIMSLFLWNPAWLSAMPTEDTYVGAQACKPCHQKEYEKWEESGHARILNKSTEAKTNNIPYPSGYSRQNISYIIGGYKWKALFLDRSGYLITSTQEGNGKNQFNLRSRQWVDYLPGRKVFYDCGRCHTTGFSAEGHQNGLEGIIGRWKFEGVQCEACHGPGRKHASTSLKTDIKRDVHICVTCHSRKPLDIIPLNGVFLEQYTETNQLLSSRMSSFSCLFCHNPHARSEESVVQSCEECHIKIAAEYSESYMYKAGVTCIDCHMPPAVMLAEGRRGIFEGDFKSHLFKIDHEKDFPVSEKNGITINPGYLSVDYSCMRCHYINQNRQWASRYGMFAHTIKASSGIKIMRLERVSTYIAFFLALIALTTGLYLKNYLFPSITMSRKKVLTLHRFCSWSAFSIYVFNVVICLYFHFPLEEPSKALDFGLFLIHPVNGIIGGIVYGGKIITVRIFKKGWAKQGLFWGILIFLFWLAQTGTIVFRYLKV